MYRHADEPFEPEQPLDRQPRRGRDFSAVPLAILTALIALAAEFFSIFLLGWGMAPTSAGCGVGRAAGVSAAALAISVVIFGLAAAVGAAALGESRSSSARPRTFILSFAAIYAVFSFPMLVFAALLGSCFDL